MDTISNHTDTPVEIVVNTEEIRYLSQSSHSLYKEKCKRNSKHIWDILDKNPMLEHMT